MLVRRCLACLAVAFPILAAGANAAGPRNGTFYGYDAKRGSVVAAAVKNGRIPVLQAMPPVTTGPGVSFYYGPIGEGSDKIARSGKWTTGDTPGGPLGPDYLTVCGSNPLGGRTRGLLQLQLGVEREPDRPPAVLGPAVPKAPARRRHLLRQRQSDRIGGDRRHAHAHSV